MMSDNELKDMGMVTSMMVSKKPGAHESYLLRVEAEAGSMVRVLTRGATQTLWFHLVHILYPDKADEVTTGVSTAMLRPADAPMITSWVEVMHDESQQIIELTGAGGAEAWTIQFTHEVGYGLWTSLERALYNR
jgi:hypothetical protein